MILTALFLAETLAGPAPPFRQDDPWSIDTKRAFIVYNACFGRAVFDRQQSAGSAEARVISAKASCRKQYDAVVESMVKDTAGKVDPAIAAADARAKLDESDDRVLPLLSPAPPPNLAELPVRYMAGEWRLGGGALTLGLTIQFTDKPSLIGRFASRDAVMMSLNTGGLRAWEIFKDERGRATFRATFADGRVASYERIPSPPSEMNFINAADPTVQRYDLLIENEQFLIRWVVKDGAGQLRFRRNVKTGSDRQPE